MNEFYKSLSARITQILTSRGELPHLANGCLYREVKAMYYYSDKSFAGFIYSNTPLPGENIEELYGEFFGPRLAMSEILPRIWDDLTYDEQTVIMTETLGSKHD